MKYIQHNHLIIRAEIKNPPVPLIDNPKGYAYEIDMTEDILNEEIKELIHAIGMKVALEPRCIFVTKPGNEGYTGQAGLETSHITYHIWNKPDPKIMKNKEAGLLQMDVYTCGCLNKKQLKIIRQWVEDMFGIIDYNAVLIDRAKILLTSYTIVGDSRE